MYYPKLHTRLERIKKHVAAGDPAYLIVREISDLQRDIHDCVSRNAQRIDVPVLKE